jgi:hypothetical protein
VLAWAATEQKLDGKLRHPRMEKAIQWLLAAGGETFPRTAELGHDTSIVGWPWVLGTHSWLEPTAWAVLALTAAGHEDHPRAQDGLRLLLDRLLPTGGCNYGNTYVLGQKLRPHLEPTGLAMLALSGRRDRSGRIEASLAYLSRNLSVDTPAISLSYALLGLAAHDQLPRGADQWLEAGFRRTANQPDAPLKLALLLLAVLGAESPLVRLMAPRQEVS